MRQQLTVTPSARRRSPSPRFRPDSTIDTYAASLPRMATRQDNTTLGRRVRRLHAAIGETQDAGRAARLNRLFTAARSRLAAANARLVIKIALHIANASETTRRNRQLDRVLDNIQRGNTGLIRAAEKYDPDHNGGACFSTYATWHIKQAIHRGWQNETYEIRVPSHVHESLTRVRYEGSSLRKHHYKRTTTLKLPTDKDREDAQVAEKALVVASLTTELKEHDPQLQVASPLVKTNRDIDQIMVDDTIRIVLARTRLTAIEATVLDKRFGTDGTKPGSLSEVGNQLGLTKERIRQIEAKALSKLAATAKRLRIDDPRPR